MENIVINGRKIGDGEPAYIIAEMSANHAGSIERAMEMIHAAKEAGAKVDTELESYVLAKIEERKAAKKEKDFAKADAIRAELLDKGIIIEDTREGVKWKKA